MASFPSRIVFAMPLELYRFKYFDALRKRWIVAAYRATKEDIAARYKQFELIGEPWTPSDVDGRDSGRTTRA